MRRWDDKSVVSTINCHAEGKDVCVSDVVLQTRTCESKWWELSSLHLCWGVGTTCGPPAGPGSSSSLHRKHSISHGVTAVPVLGDRCCCKHMFGPHWNTPHPWSSHREEKAFWSHMSSLISCHQPTDDADGLAYPMGHWNAFQGLTALWGPERY